MRRCPKIGCENPPRPEAATRGPWANLCQQHYDGRRELIGRQSAAAFAAARAEGRPGAKASRSYTADDGAGEETFEAKAKALVSYGRRLDRAIYEVKKTKVAHVDAVSLTREAMEHFKQACLRLAGAADGGGS